MFLYKHFATLCTEASFFYIHVHIKKYIYMYIGFTYTYIPSII